MIKDDTKIYLTYNPKRLDRLYLAKKVVRKSRDRRFTVTFDNGETLDFDYYGMPASYVNLKCGGPWIIKFEDFGPSGIKIYTMHNYKFDYVVGGPF